MKRKFQILALSYLIVWGLYLYVIPSTNAKYNSLISSNAKGSVAFYIINTGYQNAELSLDKIAPRNEKYAYTFSVSNYKNKQRLDVDAKYNIIIRTTTNLDLKFELYENDSKDDILISKEIVSDSYGMYYRVMKTDYEYFSYTTNTDNNYTLYVTFPIEYIGYDYQDILENVEIIIDSMQVVSE